MLKITFFYVKFKLIGAIASEDLVVSIENTDPNFVEFPNNAYAFSIHERTDVADEGEVYRGKDKQIGPLYYHPESKVMTLKEIEELNDQRDRILLENMRCNGWDAMIFTRWGNWPQPYRSDRICILESKSA